MPNPLLFPALLCLSLLLSGTAPAQPAARQVPPAQTPSIVEIPVQISLERLFRVAEQEMPLQAGNWHDWKKAYGVQTKYRAWRGPLYFTLQGDVLTVQAHVRYWIKAHKKVLGAVNLNTSCGVNEPPRQAIIGVQIRLGWSPDWMLRPDFRVMPTRFPDRCEMTIASIDMTPLIAREFQRQLENRMRDALKILAPGMTATRQQAERNWSLLQEPVQLWKDQWLLLNPGGLALSPLSGHGDKLDAHLAMLMSPQVVTGSRPASRQTLLPPLMRYYPRASGLNLQLDVALNYADLNHAISEQLAGKSMMAGGYQIGVQAIELTGQGQEIRINAILNGAATGDLQITANMLFSPEMQQLQLENLDYIYKPQDPMLEPEANLFYGVIRGTLESAANNLLQQQMSQWKRRLLGIFNKITPDNAELDLGSLQLRQARLEFTESGIRMKGLASGRISIVFR